jgi:SnoaL-like domain
MDAGVSTMDGDQKLTDLLDREAVVDLTVSYAWALDSHRFEELRQVFIPDATAALIGELHGIDAIIERIAGALTPLDDSQHIVANHQVRLNGNRATCRCYFQAQHVRRGVPGGDNYIIAGRYEDEVERTAEGWRIARRVLVPMWSDGNPDVVRPPRE